MSFDGAIEALSVDALRFVKNNQVFGLGSGRAATKFVNALAKYIKAKKLKVYGVPTSLQIKITAQKGGIQLIDADQIKKIDVVFDGADQIDAQGNLIKGGGGALLRENILISAARKVVIMADATKFVKNLSRAVPIEVHPMARQTTAQAIEKVGGKPQLRLLDRGYPLITENGNLILDCDFGVIKNPVKLRQEIIGIAGVMEVGIFTRKPDVIYKAKTGGKFEIKRC